VSSAPPVTFGPRATVTQEPIYFTEPVKLDLHVYRGDSGRFRVNVTDADGVPVDVSAAQWTCQIRATPAVGQPAPPPVANLVVVPDLQLHSQIEVQLPPNLSELLPVSAVWDLQMMVVNGPLTSVTTLLAGKVITTLDVSVAVKP
jgi:hypothetical protein